jgi:TIR domain
MTTQDLEPLVFLSHSARDDQPALDLLDALVTGLPKRGWEVYADDERLKPGTLWRHQLHTALGACDAAVILFSRKAYEDSEWVLKESTIFRWRHSLDPEFMIVPVLFPDVTRPELSEGRYRPLALGEFVPIELPKANIVAAVDKALGPKRPRVGPIERLQQSIAQKFANVTTDTLKLAAAKLGKRLDWKRQLKPHEEFAIHLFHADIAEVRAALRIVAPEMASGADVRFVVNTLEPFTVDPLAVAPIPGIVRHDTATGARPVIALNSENEETGARYIQRARCAPDPWSVITLVNAGGAQDLESLKAQLFKSARDQYFAENTDDEIRALFDTAASEDGMPFFVLVHGPVAPETLDELRNDFGSCVFFELAGESPDADALAANNIVVLTPKLDNAIEKQVRTQITLTRTIATEKEKKSR